jgi:hypothetical protein
MKVQGGQFMENLLRLLYGLQHIVNDEYILLYMHVWKRRRGKYEKSICAFFTGSSILPATQWQPVAFGGQLVDTGWQWQECGHTETLHIVSDRDVSFTQYESAGGN